MTTQFLEPKISKPLLIEYKDLYEEQKKEQWGAFQDPYNVKHMGFLQWVEYELWNEKRGDLLNDSEFNEVEAIQKWISDLETIFIAKSKRK